MSPDPRLTAFNSAEVTFSDDDDEVFLADNKAGKFEHL